MLKILYIDILLLWYCWVLKEWSTFESELNIKHKKRRSKEWKCHEQYLSRITSLLYHQIHQSPMQYILTKTTKSLIFPLKFSLLALFHFSLSLSLAQHFFFLRRDNIFKSISRIFFCLSHFVFFFSVFKIIDERNLTFLC